MRRTMAVGLLLGSLLILQRDKAAMAQDSGSQQGTPPAQSPKWETYKGIASDIKVLRVWQVGTPVKDHEIALVMVSDTDLQAFVQDPTKLVAVLNTNKVFPGDGVREVAHWVSLLSPTYAGDPDLWLLTIIHARPCRVSVTSQPAAQ
jgi:hypothetical protein